MIIYIATYPRSGTSWMGNIIWHYFGLRASSAYRVPGSRYVYESHKENLSYTGWTISYKNRHNFMSVHRRVLDNCRDLLNEEFRNELCQDNEKYFIMTHEPPPDRFIPGEHVIHVVRHPGAVFWSYYNFLKGKSQRSEISIEELIEGHALGGQWSTHTNNWVEASKRLGSQYLMVKYEEMKLDLEQIVSRVSRLIELPLPDEAPPFPNFEWWKKQNPIQYMSGYADTWIDKLNLGQKALIWAIHEKTMLNLGYRLPNKVEWLHRLGREGTYNGMTLDIDFDDVLLIKNALKGAIHRAEDDICKKDKYIEKLSRR